jgi:prefoldin subunit 5
MESIKDLIQNLRNSIDALEGRIKEYEEIEEEVNDLKAKN